ncbi:ABC transporter permease [Bradymonas sediminis]|uniref:ABC transporter permease n=1 Tax=Bradymonas sediminis TaxID=1548548 RepID=A0A2Z4FMV1_9DELT|nr:ABC transporter permease [Bradymonas sediminis]AWV90311.1 ABC transporter permease [Bradymonas sediminis]TDP75715.1 putative ABC transport system permease protein [Bradymonas sediminis]
MKYRDTIGMAVGAIARNKVRSFLTALGIIIGVASIIAIVQIGEATTRNVTDQISSIGSNLIMISPGRARRGRGMAQPFEVADYQALQNEIPDLHVAPVAGRGVTMVYGNLNHDAQVIGTTNDYLVVRNREIVAGRGFSAEELDSGAPVCVLGQTIIDTIFGRDDPLGQVLRINKIACQVIGILDPKGNSMGSDEDDFALMPLKAVQRRLLGSQDITGISVSVAQGADTTQAKAEIEALLRQRRPPAPDGTDDFRVHDMQEIVETLQGVTQALTALLGVVAAVSLLVGGIGIMNIMLVSVTERTREIGLRLAIGARARDVLTQFLIEAIAVSCLGGFLGIVLGLAGSWAAVRAMDMPFVFSPSVALIGFSFSAAIGVIFGYLPARKAAHLNPIEALRHE